MSHLLSLRDGYERFFTIALAVCLLLLTFFTKNVWADFKITRNQIRQDESVAQDRLKKNSLEKISSEEFDYQTSHYTHDQLQKLFKDTEYKQHLSHKPQNWQQKADSDSELEVESQDEDGESTIQKLFDKLFKVD